MARRNLTGAVDFTYLETYAGGDESLVEEVLGLFQEQTRLWGPMLQPDVEGWRDAVHALKGSARGIGANALAAACEQAEQAGPSKLNELRDALDVALSDVAAYRHELALQSLKAPRD